MTAINCLKKAKGFTLVELILILIVIGLIVALITPQFLELGTQIEQSNLKVIAESLNAASITNYQLNRTDPTQAVSVQNCTDVENILPEYQKLSSGYDIVPKAISGNWTICEVRHIETGTTESFVGHRVP